MTRFGEYVDWLDGHANTVESGSWHIAELDLPNKPQLCEQGQTRREALENLAKRYQKYVEREKKAHEPTVMETVGRQEIDLDDPP